MSKISLLLSQQDGMYGNSNNKI